MKEVYFRAWHYLQKKMYYRAYQKLTHILLCAEDAQDEKGKPEYRAGFDECELMEGTSVLDQHGVEVFEKDIVRISIPGHSVVSLFQNVPDMYRSRGLHPLEDVFVAHQIDKNSPELTFKILGNMYENPELIKEYHLS